MPFLNNCDFDVFISYSHANDGLGWVTDFRTKLEACLLEQLHEPAKVFWDRDSLAPNDLLDESIPNAINSTVFFA
jgi:hypothetical protein